MHANSNREPASRRAWRPPSGCTAPGRRRPRRLRLPRHRARRIEAASRRQRGDARPRLRERVEGDTSSRSRTEHAAFSVGRAGVGGGAAHTWQRRATCARALVAAPSKLASQARGGNCERSCRDRPRRRTPRARTYQREAQRRSGTSSIEQPASCSSQRWPRPVESSPTPPTPGSSGKPTAIRRIGEPGPRQG